MSHHKIASGLAFAGLLIAFHPPAIHAAPTAVTVPQYTQTDIGTLTPGKSSTARAINAAGEVTGLADIASGASHAFFWSAQGGIVDIGALPSSLPYEGEVYPVAINRSGQVLGESQVGSFISHAFLWTPAADKKSGRLVDLGTLGAAKALDSGTTAVAFNDRGQAVGTASAADGSIHGFLWTPGGQDGILTNPQMKDLGNFIPGAINAQGVVAGIRSNDLTLYDGSQYYDLGQPPPLISGEVYNIVSVQGFNSRGEISGSYNNINGGNSQFLWEPGASGSESGTFLTSAGFDFGYPTSLNDLGQVAGVFEAVPLGPQSQSMHVGLQSLGQNSASITSLDLGGLSADTSGDIISTTGGLNNLGQVVGTSGAVLSENFFFPHGFVYRDNLMYDLNRHLTAPVPDGIPISQANAINSAGQIAGTRSTPESRQLAVLLTPIGNKRQTASPSIQSLYLPVDAYPPSNSIVNFGPAFDIGLDGSAFASKSVVTLNGTPAAASNYAETLIRVHVKSSDQTPGIKHVTVTNPDGKISNTVSFTVAGGFPYPFAASVSPDHVPAGSPDTKVTLVGTGFFPQTQVILLGGQALATLSASADHSQLSVLVPASLLTSGTTISLGDTVNPNEAGLVPPHYSTAALAVLNPVPTITSITPASLIADSVSSFPLTVTGTHFVPSTQIFWNGEYFPTTYVSPTQVTAFISQANLNYPGPATVPPGPITVQVINGMPGGGTASITQTFTDGPYPAPTLTSVTPSIIAPGVGTYLTLTGSHFLHHSVIHLGSQVFSVADGGAFLSDDRTQLSFYLPPAAVPTIGITPVTVVNPGPGGGTSVARPLTVQGASLRVSSAVLTRDPVTQEIVAQVALTDSYGADATGVVLTQATLVAAGASGLPVTVGTVPAGTTTSVSLRFPAAAAAYGTAVILRVSGQYAGGSFLSSRRAIAP